MVLYLLKEANDPETDFFGQGFFQYRWKSVRFDRGHLNMNFQVLPHIPS